MKFTPTERGQLSTIFGVVPVLSILHFSRVADVTRHTKKHRKRHLSYHLSLRCVWLSKQCYPFELHLFARIYRIHQRI
jgi:hypothetical protein